MAEAGRQWMATSQTAAVSSQAVATLLAIVDVSDLRECKVKRQSIKFEIPFAPILN